MTGLAESPSRPYVSLQCLAGCWVHAFLDEAATKGIDAVEHTYMGVPIRAIKRGEAILH